MSTSTSAIFTGSSSYSKDFEQVLTRAQQIASLPIALLQNQKNTLTAEQSALNSLSSAFSSVQSAIASLNTALSGGNVGVSSSASSVATATVSSGALPGVYHLDVVDPGALSKAVSATGVADPNTASLSDDWSFQLQANGKTYLGIVPGASTLTALATAINSATHGEVQATIVNFGTAAAPSYKLSIQGTKYGDFPITLDNGLGGPNLLGAPSAGVAVQYRINGVPVAPANPLTSDTRALPIAPGLTATALTVGATDLTVTQTTAAIAGPIASFVQAYNATVTALDTHRGSSGGALSGQSVVSTLSQSLRDIANYSGSGGISSIADIGLAFDKDGVLSFDPSVLSAAAAKDIDSVTGFLGASKGSGFLKAASDILTSLTDSISGVIPSTLLSVAGEISDTGTKISENQARVDALTENLTAQLAAADAMIAQLQQQATYFTNMFAAMLANQNSMR